jgi:hypothetical protein
VLELYLTIMGYNPTTLSYNAKAVKNYNTASTLVHFKLKAKNTYFYF